MLFLLSYSYIQMIRILVMIYGDYSDDLLLLKFVRVWHVVVHIIIQIYSNFIFYKHAANLQWVQCFVHH